MATSPHTTLRAARRHAVALLDEWKAATRRQLPHEATLIDFHTHLGLDSDGSIGSVEDVSALEGGYGIERFVCFPLNETDGRHGFRAANDRLLELARNDARLVPFCRLDLGSDPVEETSRCLARGARGIKFHPRAQRATLDRPLLLDVLAVAAEHRAPVLVHAGRGLAPIAAHVAALAAAVPEASLVLAHAGIADMARLEQVVHEAPNVFVDTAVWSPVDLAAALCTFPIGRVLYGSDYPYGVQPATLLLVVRVCDLLELTPHDVRGILGGNAEALLHGFPGPRGSPAPDGGLRVPPHWERAAHWLALATTSLWTRQPDVLGALDVAERAVRADRSAETGAFVEIVRTLRGLWEAADAWRADDYKTALRLLHIAVVIAGTARE